MTGVSEIDYYEIAEHMIEDYISNNPHDEEE